MEAIWALVDDLTAEFLEVAIRIGDPSVTRYNPTDCDVNVLGATSRFIDGEG